MDRDAGSGGQSLMFSKSNKPDRFDGHAEAARGERNSVPSILSPDLTITGDLVTIGDLQIDGRIDGHVTGRHIHIGENAAVRGSLQGEMVRVGGTVLGEIRADNVVLERTARVTGDILHRSLAIEQGAFLDGRCRRMDVPAAVPVGEKPQLPLLESGGSPR